MNIHPELARQISLILYVTCSSLYLFMSLRFRRYLSADSHKLFSFAAFIILPLITAVISPRYDLFYVLTLLQLCLIASLLLAGLLHNRFADVFNWSFGLSSASLVFACLMKNPPAELFTIQIHWIGTFNAALSFLTLLLASLVPDSKLSKSTSVFIFAAALLSAFKIPPSVMMIVQILYSCALLDWIRHQANAIEERFVEAVSKTQKIEKDFKDAVRKEVNKHMFYHELSKDKIKAIAQTDDLTKGLNKKAFLNIAAEMIQDKTPFALLMFDIDKFKTINDTLGHITGDMCLKSLSLIARRSIRDNDIFARYGGDEFIILLPNSDFQNALRIAERFRYSVAQTVDPHFTVSIGISVYPNDGLDVKSVIQCADEGLYASKHMGRNAVSYKGKKIT